MGINLKLQNFLINGAFDYWQRATSFTSIANNAYHADRFHYIKSGAVVHNIARSTDVPSSSTSLYSLQASVTTADTSIVAGDYSGILQHIEGNVLRSFEGKSMVMTFWVKATKTGTYCVALRNGTSTLAYVMEYTVNASNTWEKKTLRFTHSMAGTWAYDTAIGMTVVWTLSSGSTFQTSANSWNTGNFIATANQVNGTDSTSNNFWLSDVCLVEDNDGKTRNPDFMYAGRDVFEERQLCERYYEKSGNLASLPGASGATGFWFNGLSMGGNSVFTQSFRVPKRIVPALALYDLVGNGGFGASSRISTITAAGSGQNNQTVSDRTVTETEFNYQGGGAGVGGHQYRYVADSEL